MTGPASGLRHARAGRRRWAGAGATAVLLLGLVAANAVVLADLLPGGAADRLGVDVGSQAAGLIDQVAGQRDEAASRSAERENDIADAALPTWTETDAPRLDSAGNPPKPDLEADDAPAPTADATSARRSSASPTGTATGTATAPTVSGTPTTTGPSATASVPSAPTTPPETTTTPTATTTTGPTGTLVDQVLQLVNAERAAATPACPELGVSAALTTAAQAHAADMLANEYFSHTGMDGSTPLTRAQTAGYGGTAVDETFAAGFADATAIVESWMGAPAERDKLLDCGKADTGIAYNPGTLPGFGAGILVQLYGS